MESKPSVSRLGSFQAPYSCHTDNCFLECHHMVFFCLSCLLCVWLYFLFPSVHQSNALEPTLKASFRRLDCIYLGGYDNRGSCVKLLQTVRLTTCLKRDAVRYQIKTDSRVILLTLIVIYFSVLFFLSLFFHSKGSCEHADGYDLLGAHF